MKKEIQSMADIPLHVPEAVHAPLVITFWSIYQMTEKAASFEWCLE